ncbi:MAG TPA: glycoside hydrolase family 15 protein [Dehalococcoidia bacterium]|nr:glycoside hydrolase family 15 protein [Dehalococcoidia bacterium]
MITFDATHTLSDIYFPHIGTENHAYRRHSKFGVWAGGEFSWLDDAEWERTLRYDEDTLVTRVEAANTRLGIQLEVEDAVDFDLNVLLRRFTIRVTTNRPVDVRLYHHLDVAIGGNTVGDTVFYHPESQSLVAYKNRHYLLLGGRTASSDHLDGWTTGRKDSWADAENGELDRLPIAFGSIDCVGELKLGAVQPGEPAISYAWLAAGSDLDEVVSLNALMRRDGPDTYIERTRHFWRAWVHKEAAEHDSLSELPDSIQSLYRRSLLIVKAHMDHDGAIIASSDSEITAAYSPHGESGPPMLDVFQGQESYAYSWPRDSSFVALALNNAGYAGDVRGYFAFCNRTIVHQAQAGRAGGYMLQKYLSNGAVASNVIAWINRDGTPRLPIQEDGSALVLIATRNHYEKTRDWGLLAPLYETMIKSIAEFLVEFRDSATGLPLPCQDLWEERQGVHAFTVATVWRALRDAAYFADLFAESDVSKRYIQAADEIRRGAERYLFDEEAGRFVRSIWSEDGEVKRDLVMDASVFALSYFGMFDPHDPRMVATMEEAESALRVHGEHGGYARFVGDGYQLRESALGMKVSGNPWPLCALWLAQYRLQRVTTRKDLDGPLQILSQVARSALPSGLIAEQIDPSSGEPAGATPLVWAHGTVILTVLEFLDARARAGGETAIGQ